MATEILESEKGFDSRVANGVCLACFNTPWSAPCRLQMAILEQLINYYGNQIILLDINVDYLEHLRMRFDVHHIPTMILFNNGKERRRLVGVYPESELCKAIEGELAGA